MIDKIETLLDPVQSNFDPINPTVDPGDAHLDRPEPLLDACHTYLEILNVFNDAIELRIHATQHHKNEIVGFGGHDAGAIRRYSAAIKVAPGWLARRLR